VSLSLTETLRAGTPEVFDLLYDEHAVRLYAYCHLMVGDEAADAVRDAFIAAVRHRGTAPDDEALPVWLHALARAECVRRGALLRKAAVAPHAEPLRRALARLRPEQREALALSAALETDELARVVGIAPDTAELLLRLSRRRLEQAAASVLGGRAVRDDDMLTALGTGSLHKLVTRGCEPPPRLREQVLFSCAAAERAPDGALLFDQDGMPVPLDGLFGPADEITRPIAKISDADIAVAPEKNDLLVSRARPKKKLFLTRRRHGLVEIVRLAACVVAATGVLAVWPGPHDDGTSNLDGTSLPLHRGSPASRTTRPAAGTSPQQATTSGVGTSPAATPAKGSSAPTATAPPVTTTPAHTGTPPTAGPTPTHPTPRPSTPRPSTPQPSTPPSTTPAPTPTASTPPPDGTSTSPSATPAPSTS
jgi:DNA-directed RNA polymerase specialized sigma24 family protein